ncbi:hypothetical protein SNE40_019226 [Patella caerulea]|uniref:NADH dehydrogenase [ubiquinone] 1 beta subcomplex subunit 8, mitochondrial n=1 Tax=Patella caerulea TaxID=87958 RepID=A0AAN8J8V4_PATCE
MATLRTSCRTVAKLKRYLVQRTVATSSVVSNWNKDWQPGPFPKTQEERIAAAKKYGLRVEDYQVYPDDGLGYGDYPKLPIVSGEHRDPYEDWDDPGSKTNYNEVRHVDHDLYLEYKLDPNRKRQVSLNKQLLQFLGAVTAIMVVYVLCEPYPFFQPVLPKQFPFNDLYLEKGGDPSMEPTVKHYTFESPE